MAAASRSPLNLEKPKKSPTESVKVKILDIQSMTPEEKNRYVEEKMKEMSLKNAQWSKRYDEVENDKKEAGFTGRRAFTKSYKETPPRSAAAPPDKHQLEMNMTGAQRITYEKWSQERRQIDEERLERQKRNGEWRREWDKDKQEFYQISNDDQTPPTRRNYNNNQSSSSSSSSFGQRNAYQRFPTNGNTGGHKFQARRGFSGGFIRRDDITTTAENRQRSEFSGQQGESWDDELNEKTMKPTTTLDAKTTTTPKHFQRYSEKREQKAAIDKQENPPADQEPQPHDQQVQNRNDLIAEWDREIADYERKIASDLGDDSKWEDQSSDESPPINMAHLPVELSVGQSSSDVSSGQFDDVGGKSSVIEEEIASDTEISRQMDEIEQQMLEKLDENMKRADAILDDEEREDAVEKFVEDLLAKI